MNNTELVVEIRPEKNSGPYRIWTHDLCDTGATLQYRRGHGFKSRTGLNFSGLISTASSVVFITARIAYTR